MTDYLEELEKFRTAVGKNRAIAYQGVERMVQETKKRRFSNASFPEVINLWSIIAMIKIFIAGIEKPRVLQCWFDPLWLPGKLAELGIGPIDVVDFRKEEIEVERENYSSQRYNLTLRNPIKEELPFGSDTFDAVIVHTIMQHLDEQTLKVFFGKLRKVAKNGAVMLVIFKKLPKGDLRKFLDRIGQQKAIIHDAESGDVSLWEKKLKIHKRIHLWEEEGVLKIARETGWDLVESLPEAPSKIAYLSGEKKLPHCAFFLRAV